MATNMNSLDCNDMCSPVRNRFFYGKAMGVMQFNLEQDYFNNKRWLLNRLVSGWGVVCGLNVTLGADNQSVVVGTGLAIDKCGREIVVCQPSGSFPLPPPLTPKPNPGPAAAGAAPANGQGGADGGANPGAGPVIAPPPPPPDCGDTGVYKHLSICYHECMTDPSPALGGDCDSQPLCAPGSIRERYSLKLSDGRICPASTTTSLPNVISNGTLNYQALVSYVTNLPCCANGTDCCIPLANIQIPLQPQTYTPGSIDISIRPVVYTADLLYQLMLAWMGPSAAALRGGK